MLFALQAVLLGLALQTEPDAVLSVLPDAAGSPHSNSLLVKADEKAAASAKEAAEKPATASDTAAAKGRAQVLVMVSDHGSGTSNLEKALGTHPCMFSLGETFGTKLLWSKGKDPAECTPGRGGEFVLFDADSGNFNSGSVPPIEKEIAGSIEDCLSNNLGKDRNPIDSAHSLFPGLQYNLADYYVRVRDLVCKGVPADVCPPSDCTISVKMFPAHVDGKAVEQFTKADVATECTLKKNDEAMEAWKKELDHLKQNPKVATLKVTRNERDRQFSTFHRFGIDPEFDCSFPRPPSSFATASKEYADVEIQNENCWADAPGAETCLRDALQLVNLSAESKGFLKAATEVIIGQSTNTKQEIATESCSTSPGATFKRMANGEVHKKDDTVQVADQIPCVPHRLPDYSWSWCPAAGAVTAPKAPVPEAVAAPAPEDPEDPEDPELVPEAIVSPAPEDPEDPELSPEGP